MAQTATTNRREKSILYEEDDTDPEDCEDCQDLSGMRCFRHYEE